MKGENNFMAFARNTGRGPAKGTLEYFEAQSRSGWIFWIITLLLSVINVAMSFTADPAEGFDIYLLSAYLPLDFVVSAKALAVEFGSSIGTTILYAIAVGFLLVGILTAIFWKKHPAWPLVANILYGIDCIFFFVVARITDAKLIIGHVGVMLLLVVGYVFALKAHKARKAAAEELGTTVPQPAAENAANNYKGPEL